MTAEYSFGDYVLDRRRHTLRRGDEEICLGERSFGVLALLVENAGRVVGRQELIDSVWHDVAVSDDSLARAVSDLRTALGDDSSQPTFIRTVHRRGYLFIAPVTPIDFSHTSIGLHFSGCATSVPGWTLVSTHDEDLPSHTWLDDQVFAMELRPGGRVVRLAHTHSVTVEGAHGAYWAEPHATVNRDFTRVLFGTNWARVGADEVETYLIDLPRGWIQKGAMP
jgi:DNA-binding winged helix-turn-helix (wHTH) protein